jgi:hypothetical protein
MANGGCNGGGGGGTSTGDIDRACGSCQGMRSPRADGGALSKLLGGSSCQHIIASDRGRAEGSTSKSRMASASPKLLQRAEGQVQTEICFSFDDKNGGDVKSCVVKTVS